MPKGYKGRVVSAVEATRRWRERNPEKVAASNRKPRVRLYNSDYKKKWWAGISDELRKTNYEKANIRDTAIRRWLDAYKLSVGCIDCGYKKHPAALHFDHVSGKKELNVCNSKSINRAKREIEKCAVRCANCHAEKTFTFHPCKPDIFTATYDPVTE